MPPPSRAYRALLAQREPLRRLSTSHTSCASRPTLAYSTPLPLTVLSGSTVSTPWRSTLMQPPGCTAKLTDHTSAGRVGAVATRCSHWARGAGAMGGGEPPMPRLRAMSLPVPRGSTAMGTAERPQAVSTPATALTVPSPPAHTRRTGRGPGWEEGALPGLPGGGSSARTRARAAARPSTDRGNTSATAHCPPCSRPRTTSLTAWPWPLPERLLTTSTRGAAGWEGCWGVGDMGSRRPPPSTPPSRREASLSSKVA